MSALPKYAQLGITDPDTRVLQWYLACVHPKAYEQVQSNLVRGVEMMNPILAFENMVRHGDGMSVKDVLECASSCFALYPSIVRDSVRWMTRWEKELTSLVAMQISGNRPLDIRDDWSQDKQTAYALILAHMGAVNWDKPAFVQAWSKKTAFMDMNEQQIKDASAKAYWRAINTLPEPWQDVVFEAMVERCPQKNRESLLQALNASQGKDLSPPENSRHVQTLAN